VAGIQSVGIQRLFECIDLGAGNLDLGLADLREVTRPDVATSRPMMTITTSSSSSVKPRCCRRWN